RLGQRSRAEPAPSRLLSCTPAAGSEGAWQFRWEFSLGGVTYLSSWGNIWFQRPLRWRVASARKASSPLKLQNWPVSLKRRWYWEQVDSMAPEPTGWPRAFPLL